MLLFKSNRFPSNVIHWSKMIKAEEGKCKNILPKMQMSGWNFVWQEQSNSPPSRAQIASRLIRSEETQLSTQWTWSFLRANCLTNFSLAKPLSYLLDKKNQQQQIWKFHPPINETLYWIWSEEHKWAIDKFDSPAVWIRLMLNSIFLFLVPQVLGTSGNGSPLDSVVDAPVKALLQHSTSLLAHDCLQEGTQKSVHQKLLIN